MFKSKFVLYGVTFISLVLTILSYRAMSPWFWVFLFGSIMLACVAIGSAWALRSAIWFGTFFVVKMLTRNGFIAFIVASIVSHITRDLLYKFSARKQRYNFG